MTRATRSRLGGTAASRRARSNLCPWLDTFRLIKAVPVDPARVCAAFEALATRVIQKRDRCDRMTALQRAVDEKPPRAGSQRMSPKRTMLSVPGDSQ
jgi:transposase